MRITPTSTSTRAPILAAGLALAAAALVGCGGGEPRRAEAPVADTAAPATAPSRPRTTTAPSWTPRPPAAPTTAPQPVLPDGPLRAVSLVDELVVLDGPDGTPITTVASTTAFGTPTVLGVTDRPADGWVPVLVNARPNELRGVVRASDVTVEALTAEVHVDLTARTLRVVEDGVETSAWPIAIGTAERPTPTGRFFITDKLATGDPASVWGELALGISAYSSVLTDFIGGVGQIGIHGTNDPTSIGKAASSGCIRLPNEAINQLIDRLPLGTPVHIV